LALLTDAAARTGRSTASLSRIENGVVSIPPRDVPPILDAYGVTDSKVRDKLMIVAAEIQQERRGWWLEHGDVLAPTYIDLIRLEATAEEIWTYEIQVVPGLLQTDAYARAAALTAWEPNPAQLDEFVGVRMSRKRILTDDQPITLRIVLGEAALHHQLGGAAVFRDQLEHLLIWAQRDNVDLRVLPFVPVPHPGMAGGFTILRLPSLDVAHVELMISDAYIEDEDSVARYQHGFQRLADLALSAGESMKLISRMADTL
jgi:hypothetical protein